MKNRLALVVMFCACAMFLSAQEEARVLRFPAVHGDTVVFSYAGDLYAVPAAGGVARKMTSHDGFEMFPRFSPDGRTLAFTAEYDGNREVYVMPAAGGIPRRITYSSTLRRDDVSDRMGPNNIVMGWTPDGKHIVFRSRLREWNDFVGQLYLAPAQGGMFVPLPLPRGGFCSYSPDGKKIAYNRVFREFRTWKRYRGGMADDVWIFDFETKTLENITNNAALDIIPMWSGETVYFLSDRDANKRLNLYAYDLKTKQTRQLTQFAEFDIKFPSLGDKAIVFENGGYIYRFDLASEKTAKVPVQIDDDRVSGRAKLATVSARVANYEIAPDGKRALFGARGDIFTVPAEFGNTRNLTKTPGIHERASKWSPDGKWISYISDATGEDEIYLLAQDGSGQPVQLTDKADTYKYGPIWSPDGKKLLWSDKLLRLQYVDIATKKVVPVAQAKIGEIMQFAWSPDSNWVAYAKPEAETMMKVYLYALENAKTYEVTDGWHDSYGPAFSADGKYLFLISDRDFNPVYSRTEFNHAYQAMSKIYLVTLAAATPSPFAPKSDEVEVKKDEPAASAKPEAKKEEKPAVTVKVDPDGLKDRILSLPVEVANYRGITSVGDKVYYMKRGDRDRAASLNSFSLKDRKETDLGTVNGYEISADQKKMLVLKDGAYAIIDLPQAPVKVEKKLDLADMTVSLDLKKEWEQIFLESWRQMKYFFYAPNMHGVDWEGLKQRYLPLAQAVNCRADLTYVIGEMIGELSTGHTYVGGGDLPVVPRVQVGQLGAALERDASGFYKISQIFRGQNWTNTLRSPLTELGVNVEEGNYILAVDGRPTNDLVDIYETLVNTVGKQVRLKVNARPEDKGSREVTVVPISDEQALVYYTWVQENIETVDRATQGKVGYLHIPDMGVGGLNEFVKYYYPQLRKKALIIDVRGNGGGNVSPMIIERLRREVVMAEMSRDTIARFDPDSVLAGPKVCLVNEYSASDGDIFPYRFKQYKLGKLIGKRTWGGVVGIRGTLPLLDGGFLNKPEFAPFSLDGKQWIMEGIGVEPDIVVDNDPAREFAGIDDQLNRAIEVILEELKTKEREVPPIPPYPVKK
ncbi:MAG: PDZ domain-containing protein [Candidatus Aminicenantes bacterium]|nr:PDZ domain-containing protein [Candidatus Aminicenantes bacterium]